MEAYQQIEAERAILDRLAQGELEIASGEGYDLDYVLNEADILLRLRSESKSDSSHRR